MEMFSGPREKIIEAREGIAQVRDLLAPLQCMRVFKQEDDSSYEFEYKFNEQPPPRISTKIGSVANLLRSTLDNVVSEIAEHKRPNLTLAQKQELFFPIKETKDDLDKVLVSIRSFVKQPTIDIIKKYKPFRDGNPVFYGLHDLDVMVKHRKLVDHYAGAFQIMHPLWQIIDNLSGLPAQYRYAIPGVTFTKISKSEISSPLAHAIAYGPVEPLFRDGLFFQHNPALPILDRAANLISCYIDDCAAEFDKPKSGLADPI